MNKPILGAFAFIATLAFSQAQFIDLVSLGSASYTIEPSVSSGSYTQDSSGTRFSPSVSLGDTVGGTFGPLDWSSYSDLTSSIYVKISFTGANPLLPMTLQLFTSDFSLSNTYQGTTTPISESPNYFKFDLVGSSAPAVLAGAGGAQITWDGGATVDANLEAIATVPEPSTYALLSLAGLALCGYALRRRRCA